MTVFNSSSYEVYKSSTGVIDANIVYDQDSGGMSSVMLRHPDPSLDRVYLLPRRFGVSTNDIVGNTKVLYNLANNQVVSTYSGASGLVTSGGMYATPVFVGDSSYYKWSVFYGPELRGSAKDGVVRHDVINGELADTTTITSNGIMNGASPPSDWGYAHDYTQCLLLSGEKTVQSNILWSRSDRLAFFSNAYMVDDYSWESSIPYVNLTNLSEMSLASDPFLSPWGINYSLALPVDGGLLVFRMVFPEMCGLYFRDIDSGQETHLTDLEGGACPSYCKAVGSDGYIILTSLRNLLNVYYIDSSLFSIKSNSYEDASGADCDFSGIDGCWDGQAYVFVSRGNIYSDGPRSSILKVYPDLSFELKKMNERIMVDQYSNNNVIVGSDFPPMFWSLGIGIDRIKLHYCRVTGRILVVGGSRSISGTFSRSETSNPDRRAMYILEPTVLNLKKGDMVISGGVTEVITSDVVRKHYGGYEGTVVRTTKVIG